MAELFVHSTEPAMVTTLLHNRISGELPALTHAPLPECERERGRLWNDAVLEAVLALQKQLGSRNEEIVAAAANSILELERTRMRHDKTVAGTRDDRLRDEVYPEETRPVPAESNKPIFTVAEETQVAGHAREIQETAGLSGVEAVAFVVEKLGQWRVRPGQIHPGEFATMVRLMDEKMGVPRSGA